jgi:hypothetical protein
MNSFGRASKDVFYSNAECSALTRKAANFR